MQAGAARSSADIETLVDPDDLEALIDYGFLDESLLSSSLEVGQETFLLAFLERAMRDYIELDPLSQRKGSEFSDGWTESQEWMSAASFIFEGEVVMHPANFTFDEICDILDVNPDLMRERLRKATKEGE